MLNEQRQKEYDALGLPWVAMPARYDTGVSGPRLNERNVFSLMACNAYHAQKEEIERLSTYAGKLADGLPDGMLPKDVENMRNANAYFAAENESLREELENMVIQYGCACGHPACKWCKDTDSAREALRKGKE